ncbi:MAG: PIN domain-containing protein [Chloroflexaceae bacterium]
MRILPDTSVLVAAMVNAHPAHGRALPWLQRIRAGTVTGIVAAHSIAETYAVLTRLPVQPRITPHLAYQVILHNVLQICTIIALTPDDYRQIVADLAGAGLAGGVTYDVPAVYTAKQALVDQIVTLNVKDFRRIYPNLQANIVEP